MKRKAPHASPVGGYNGLSRLGVDALVALSDVVESMHGTIAAAPWLFGGSTRTRTRGITGLVYRSIRGTTRLAGYLIDALLARSLAAAEPASAPPEREALIAALNGLVGDHLAQSGNPLALPMRFRVKGQPLELSVDLAHQVPGAGPRVLLLVHGSCMSDLAWTREGLDYGQSLARDLGYTPVYLQYNSGRHISQNGRELAHLLEALVRLWPVPVEELAILGHSMGGLVARSACHYAALDRLDWPRRLEKLVFLGTPHHGSHLERGGLWIHFLLELTPYSGPLARLGKLRSAGVTDLRHGNLVDEDWMRRDRFTRGEDPRVPVPLPAGTKCYAIATAFGQDPISQEYIGDGLVPLSSALGRHLRPERTLHFTETRQWVGQNLSHVGLLQHPEVYEQVRTWLAV
jgi:pimeloyl-ACP methyl ester carboxylesterase